MALGTWTFLSVDSTGGAKRVRFTLQLTSGANHVEAGSALDLSASARTVARGFIARVDGVAFQGYSTAPAGNAGYVFSYVRAAAGAPATGVLRIQGGAAAGVALATVPAGTDLSAVVAIFEAVGV